MAITQVCASARASLLHLLLQRTRDAIAGRRHHMHGLQPRHPRIDSSSQSSRLPMVVGQSRRLRRSLDHVRLSWHPEGLVLKIKPVRAQKLCSQHQTGKLEVGPWICPLARAEERPNADGFIPLPSGVSDITGCGCGNKGSARRPLLPCPALPSGFLCPVFRWLGSFLGSFTFFVPPPEGTLTDPSSPKRLPSHSVRERLI
jgi:hypothetical protein